MVVTVDVKEVVELVSEGVPPLNEATAYVNVDVALVYDPAASVNDDAAYV